MSTLPRQRPKPTAPPPSTSEPAAPPQDEAPKVTPIPAPEGWPEEMSRESRHGILGRIIDAYCVPGVTEADPNAILVQILFGFGNLIGRRAHLLIEGSRHYMNDFAVLVGESSRARKGTSWKRALEPLRAVDPDWTKKNVKSGMSSGEGLIEAIRDPEDPNAASKDKRLFVQEEEFASVLKNTRRQGNILSVMVRKAWDDGGLEIMTRNPIRATDAHITIIGHITRDELKECLDQTEQANGFANRFLWFTIRRRYRVPESTTPMMQALFAELASAVNFARTVELVQLANDTKPLWHTVYGQFSDGGGLTGLLTNRAEAHVLRIAAMYALLDQSSLIHPVHLRAALSVWEFSERSVRFIFGQRIGTPVGDTIVAQLRKAPDGLTRSEIRALFNGHQSSDHVDGVLQALLFKKILDCRQVKTTGRPKEVWTLHDGGPPAPPYELPPGLRKLIETFDDRSAALLWQQARTREPDITPTELLHFVALQMPAIRTGKIHSPVQFILSAVPKMIEGTALAELRKKGQPEPEPVETIEEMESKLDLWYASAADSRKILETSTDPQVIDVQTQNLAGTQRRITEYETKLKEARGRGNGRNSANSAKSSKSHVQ